MKKVAFLILMLCTMIVTDTFANTDSQRERGKSKRVKSTELTINKTSNGFTVNKGGSSYDGAFWSEDGETMQFIATNGKMTRYIVFYPNRKICYLKSDAEIFYYNRNGQRISKLAPKDLEYCKQMIKEHGPEGLQF